MEPTGQIRLADGRVLAFDDVGDSGGAPVVYLHGTPDSRFARHPDDAVATARGVRLVAVDRPGSGASDPHPGGGLTALGDDLVALLDALDITRAALLGWSAGGLFSLAAASVLGERALRVVLVGPVPPVEAYSDSGVVASLGPARRAFVELASEVPGPELAAEVAQHLVPLPLSHELARDHVLEGAGEQGRRELAAVPGALERMVAALEGSVAQGLAGLVHDVELQLRPGLDLRRVVAPMTTVHGELDEVSPPEVGRWLRERAPHVTVVTLPGEGHHLVFPRWAQLLDAAAHGSSLPPGDG